MTPRLAFNPGLNPVALADLAGLPPGTAGSRANQWLGSWSIGQRMAERSEVLAAAVELAGGAAVLTPLPTVQEHPTATMELVERGAPWPALLGTLVAQGHSPSLDLADDLGRVLGGLVVTLVSGPAESRAARPEWPPARWESWSRVRRVVLGGGIVAGALGERMLVAASDWLSHVGSPVDIALARDPAGLVLRGAATGGVPGGHDAGLVLDCGGTTLKRAVLRAGTLSLRPPSPAPVAGLAAYEIIDRLVAAAAELDPPGDGPLGLACAVATYVDPSGQPYAGQLGPYAPLGSVDLVGELAHRLRARLSREVTVRVRHDGASALLGARDDDPAVDAVIVLGTAIGNAVEPVKPAGASEVRLPG